MNGDRERYLHPTHLHQRWMWRAVVLLQLGGLLLVVAASPIFLHLLFTPSAHAADRGLFDNRTITVIASTGFLLLVIFNSFAVFGIWRLQHWVGHFFLVKLCIDLFLILSVFLFDVDVRILFICIPLFCSLCFLTLAYPRLRKGRNDSPSIATIPGVIGQ
ncbi:MAG: hypothetical protein V1778_02140 [bacterium]